MMFTDLASSIKNFMRTRGHLLWLSIAVFGMILSSCETPEKLMKNPDINYKLKVATEWYNKKEYFKCIPVFEELMGLMKGQRSTEDIYFMYCMANYYQGDYMIAAYHFKSFANTYPLSPKAEECLFMAAISNSKLSPKYELDQSYTTKAIDAFQSFINQFPKSVRVDSANRMMTTLRKKLEKKAWSNAELYYKTSNFKAAAVSFENLLIQFPDIDNTERIYFMVEKSYNNYAENSIALRKVDRYHSVIAAYKNFTYKYPNSQYTAEALKYEQDAHFFSTDAAYERVFSYSLLDREKQFLLAIKECNDQLPFIKDAKQAKKCNETIEKCYLGIVKNNYDLAEEQGDTNAIRRDDKKADYYDRTVKSYYNFVDKYKNGKYYKEAEKVFAMASDNLTKLKRDGQKQKD
jgi:outer membrane protein assembly factor BamD